MLTIHVWPRRLKEFLLTHPLYKSPKWDATGYLCKVNAMGGAGARPRTLRTSHCLAATFGSVAATWLEAMPRQSRHHRRPLRVRRPQDTNTGLKPDTK